MLISNLLSTLLRCEGVAKAFVYESILLDAPTTGPADFEETKMAASPNLPALFLTAMCWVVVYCATLVVLWKLLCKSWRIWNLRSTSDPASGLSHLPLPPGDFGFPLFGETLSWLKQDGKFNSIRRQKHGNVFKTNVIGIPMILVTGHELVKQVLCGENETVTAIWPTAIRNLLGENGIATTTGAAHWHKRKLAHKAYTRSALNSYIPMITTVCIEAIKEMGQADQPKVYSCMQRLAFSTAMRTLANLNVKTNAEFEKIYSTFKDLADNLISVPLNIPFLGYYKGLQARKNILNYLHAHVQEKRQYLVKKTQMGNDDVSDEFLDAFSIMQLEHLKYQQRRKAEANNHDKNNVPANEDSTLGSEYDALNVEMRDLAMKEMILELLFAGYSTTASVATSAILEISRHPEIFRNIEEELLRYGHMREDGSEGEEPFEEVDLTKLHELQYLDQVVKETMRFHPPILGGFRRAKKTFQLGDYRVPKGWTVVYNIRDTHDYESGGLNEFNPDRFATKLDKENKFKYLPFGGGPRVCPGQEFARIVIKFTIVEMIRHFKGWELTGQNPPVMRAIPNLRPVDGMPVKFIPRKTVGFVQ